MGAVLAVAAVGAAVYSACSSRANSTAAPAHAPGQQEIEAAAARERAARAEAEAAKVAHEAAEAQLRAAREAEATATTQNEAAQEAKREAELRAKQAEEYRRRAEQVVDNLEKELKEEKGEIDYPRPQWLPKGGIHFGFVGDAGTGKSSLINLVLGVDEGSPEAAATGVTETTQKATPYDCPGLVNTKLWDLPGLGTPNHPRRTYLKECGLRYFDAVGVLVGDRWSENVDFLLKELNKFKVPYFLIRSKLDSAIQANKRKGVDAQGTIVELRTMLKTYGAEHPQFVISSWEPEIGDTQALLACVRLVIQYRARDFNHAELMERMKVAMQQCNNAQTA
eukprot:TRINITY_DN3057_c0_g1_i1.p1 TRINITY_DN3057_c0_g1~~TRINITY_DN3057_c0_g1_i1.p1  ORF type:complete len:337 (-),score=40.51 TRINITY_DN3057_c0_g1_i1:60-1070(-)